jgi:TPR repeat protein
MSLSVRGSSQLPADQGLAKAQFNFGVMLENGEGSPMNKPLAARLCKLFIPCR